jgi:Reverse transcriptase (RNA-dependent DNA polymerase)
MNQALLKLTPEQVKAHLDAGKPWEIDADVPDPLRNSDIRYSADRTAEVLGRRIREGLTTGNPHCFQVDKPDKTKRPFVYLDPVAQLYFRVVTTGAIAPILQNLPAATIHVRPIMLTNCWQAEAWRTAREYKMSRLAEAKSDLSLLGGFHAKFDVANHYPTVSLRHLCFLLQSFQASELTLNRISDFLSSLHAFSRLPPGLPTGPEASAILGTAVLIPVDRALGELNVFSATRWMDDIEVFDSSHDKIEVAIARVREVLRNGGQALNDTKTSITPIEQVQFSGYELSGNSEIDFPSHEHSSISPIGELEQRCRDQDPDRVPYLLGGFRSRQNPAAIRILERYPWCTRRFPKQTGSYLSAVPHFIQDRDRDWMAERALAPTDSGNVMEQVRIGYALREAKCLSVHGQKLFDKSIATNRADFAPLSDALACAAGSSIGKTSIRKRQAVEQAMELSDFNAQRSHFSALRNGSRGRQTEHALEEILKRNPDMLATVHWLRSVTPI